MTELAAALESRSAPATYEAREAIVARGVSKHYRVYKGHSRGWLKSLLLPFAPDERFFDVNPALSDVDLTILRGETLGVLGRNGSGKSTLLRVLAGVTSPTHGTVSASGRMRCLLSTGIGFEPQFTGRENIIYGSVVMGVPPDVAEERVEDILDFAELREHADKPTMYYSSGMRTRLAFAVALQEIPDILMLDEALSAGDAYFQAKASARIKEICRGGSTVIVVTHSTEFVERMCTRAILLERGRIVAEGDSTEVADRYRAGLVAAQTDRLQAIPPQAQPEVVGSAGSGSSSLGVRLVDVFMSGVDGEPRNEFGHGDALELHLRIESEGRLPTLRFELDLFSDDTGIRVTKTGTEHLSRESGELGVFPLRDLDGSYDLIVRWPENPLGTGNYYWTLSIRPFDADETSAAGAEVLRTSRLAPFRSVSFPEHPIGQLRSAIVEAATEIELNRLTAPEQA